MPLYPIKGQSRIVHSAPDGDSVHFSRTIRTRSPTCSAPASTTVPLTRDITGLIFVEG
jgi:hypothetical protein